MCEKSLYFIIFGSTFYLLWEQRALYFLYILDGAVYVISPINDLQFIATIIYSDEQIFQNVVSESPSHQASVSFDMFTIIKYIETQNQLVVAKDWSWWRSRNGVTAK